MHELSLAQNMVKAALQAEGVTARNLCTLNINCGVLAGVNIQSLRFGLELTCEQFQIEGVNINIKDSAAELKCKCGCCYTSEDIFGECPGCGSSEQRVIGGKDIFLESVEVENG